MKNRLTNGLFFLLLTIGSVGAAGAVPAAASSWSLERVVAEALIHNSGLRAQQIGPAIAGTFEAQEQARFDANLFAELEMEQRRLPDRLQQSSERVEWGLRQRLPTGTEIILSFRGERNPQRFDGRDFSARGGIQLTQALLQGARMEANLVRLEQAGLDMLASEYELRGFVEILVADVERAFWDLVLAQEEVRIFSAAQALAARQLNETLARIAAGDRPETEAIRGRAELALRRQGRLEAEAALRIAGDRLTRLVRPPGDPWDVVWILELPAPLDELPSTEDTFPPTVYAELARNFRSEINEARLRLERSELELIQTRDGLLPRLDFFAALGTSGYARVFPEALTGRDATGHDLSAGLRFEMPIGRRGARAGVERSILQRQSAVEALRNLEHIAVRDVRSAAHEIARTRAQIEARSETLELQRELVRVAEIRFRVGTGTGLDLAQAQRDLLESELNLLSAWIRHRQARTDLLQQSGTLLLHRGIDVPGLEPWRGPDERSPPSWR
jgi:outer membrane protein